MNQLWKFLRCCVLGVALSGHAHAADGDGKPEPKLYSVDKDGKWGCIDATGKVVVPLQYEAPFYPSTGLSPIKVGEIWGYADAAGKIVIAPRFGWASGFIYDGLALTTSKDLRREFIDKTGRVVGQVPQGYDVNSLFFDGLAKATIPKHHGPHGKSGLEVAESNTGFIDSSGQWIIKPTLLDAGIFSGGLAPFAVGSGRVEDKPKWGFLDKTGKVVIAPQFDSATTFYDGLAMVKANGRAFFINKTGGRAFPTDYKNALWFSEGLCAVEVDGKWGFIDTSGAMKIAPQFETGSFFKSGRATFGVSRRVDPVTDNNYTVSWKMGYIDTSGKIIVPLIYDYAEQFIGDLARVTFNINSRVGYGYINRDGKVVWAPAPKSTIAPAPDFAKGFDF